MKLNPLFDRVVIRNVETEEVTKGGILLTSSAKEKPQMAEVVAVGPGGVIDGKEIKMVIKVGDKVVYTKYAGTEVKVDGEEVEVTQEELLRGYMRQSDYTRKTQQLANERQQVEQFYAQRQMYQQPQQPQSPPEQQENLNDIAKRLAAQRLGLDSPEDLSELDFDHITAVVEAKQALLNQRNSMMARQQNIDNLEAQLRSEEPKYDEIMANINDAMQNLPVSRFNQLKQAYAYGNPEPLREFFREMQKEYYSKAIKKVEQNKNKSVPKVVQTSNTPVEKQAQRKKIDFRKLGAMSTD